MSAPDAKAQSAPAPTATSHRIDLYGVLLAVIGAIAFSGKAIIVKLGYRYGVDAVTLLALRMLVALPFFVLMGFWAARRAQRWMVYWSICSQSFLIRFDPMGTWSYHNVTIPVVYSQQMVAESGHSVSPSASKPAKVAEALRQRDFPVDFFPPDPATREDFLRVHDPQFVNGVFDGRVDNGFGNRSMEVARSLPYTSGSMITAAKLPLSRRKSRPVVAALCSGFHHATWNEAEGFCTFNGLMVAAAHLLHQREVTRIALIDADYHYGNGTDDILDRTGLRANVFHFSFGKEFKRPDQAGDYLNRMRALEPELARFERSATS